MEEEARRTRRKTARQSSRTCVRASVRARRRGPVLTKCTVLNGNRARLEEARALQKYRRRELGISAGTLTRDVGGSSAAGAARGGGNRSDDDVDSKIRSGGGLVRCVHARETKTGGGRGPCG